MIVDSLKKRYFYKLGGNIVGFILSFISASIVPRSLGVVNYGNYGYLTNIFAQIVAFFDFKTSTCFYIKKSQNQDDNKIVIFYLYIVLIVFFLLLLTTFLFIIPPIKFFFFKSQLISWLFYASFLSFFVWLIDVLANLMDAVGKTVSMEKIRMYAKIIGVLFLTLLFYINKLNLNSYFIFQILISLAFIIPIGFFINRYKLIRFSKNKISKIELLKYSKAFFKFSFPLVGYMTLQLIGNIFDRWILQRYCGSHEQGLYSLSFSLMQVMFLFVNAIYPLLTREVSIAAGNSDFDKIAEILRKYYPILFAIVAFFCSFIFVNSLNVIFFLGGKGFEASQLSMKILMFYPLINAFSGLNSAIVYSTNRTKIFFIIALIFTPLGILFDIVFISPNFLNLGALGLAIKIVSFELISLIIVFKINSKIVSINVFKYLTHFLFVGVFISIAYLSTYISALFICNYILCFIISGFVYSLIIWGLTWHFPYLLGLNTHTPKLMKEFILKLKILKK